MADRRDTRVNDRIRTREVRLVGSDGSQLGIKPLNEALALARSQGLDLVEVAPMANPPVCKVMDWGKHLYEESQRARESRKRQTQIVIKEMKFRPKIDVHDYETKKKHVVRFLEEGAKVKITIMFRGREMTHTELGARILDRLAEDLSDMASVEAAPKLDGRNMIMVLAPFAKKDAKDERAETVEKVRRPKGKGRTRRGPDGERLVYTSEEVDDAEDVEDIEDAEDIEDIEDAEEAEAAEVAEADAPADEQESSEAAEA